MSETALLKEVLVNDIRKISKENIRGMNTERQPRAAASSLLLISYTQKNKA
jgi:hypothetical protein